MDIKKMTIFGTTLVLCCLLHSSLSEENISFNRPCVVRGKLDAGTCDHVLRESGPEADMVLIAEQGTRCALSGDGSVVSCHDGDWIEMKSPTLVHREKRQLGLLITGVAIAGAGLLFNVICTFVCAKPKPPNTPPSLTCPPIAPVHEAAKGKSYAVVSWDTTFKGSDKENGKLTPTKLSGWNSGQKFEEGSYSIQYRVQDKGKLTASCDVQFRVKVKRCQPIHWPSNGVVQCDKNVIWGSKCNVSCDEGYEKKDKGEATCEGDHWSAPLRCTEKKCMNKPNITHGSTYCMEEPPIYKSSCSISCAKGYSLEGPITIFCTRSTKFSGHGGCVDSTPPTFVNDCPVDIEDFAEKNGQKVVTWTEPRVTDNSGVAPKLTIHPPSGTTFKLGRTAVHVIATDVAGNEAKCSFSVDIKSLACEEPKLDKSGKDLLLYSCPDGMAYGRSCEMSCKSGYPLEGSTRILCDKRPGTYFPPKVTWTWPTDTLEPYCKINPCHDLREPLNGALVCDRWNHGKMCQMQCNDKFDVPRKVPDQYVCGESNGEWRPSDDVQDCSVKRNPGSMKMPSELYYYSGDCHSQTSKEQIQDNFIKMLKSNILFREECGGNVPDCKAEFVNVKCGDVTRRRRRRRAAKKNIIIEFNIVLPYHDNNSNISHVIASYEQNFKKISDVLDKAVRTRTLDIGLEGLELQDDSFAPGTPDFQCGKGMMARYSTASCAGCPTGTFYDEDTDDCQDCAKGSFSDSAFSTTCKPCPDGFSTLSTGARDQKQCLETCKEGHYSATGIVPCVPCSVGSFQGGIGQTACITCPIGESTVFNAATSLKDCLNFDFHVENVTSEEIGVLKTDLPSFTLYFWVKFINSGDMSITIEDSTGSKHVQFTIGQTASIQIGSSKTDMPVSPRLKTWMHVMFLFDDGTKTVTLKVADEHTTKDVTSTSSLGTSGDLLTVSTSGAATMSGLNLVDRVLSIQEQESVSTSCGAHIDETALNFTLRAVSIPSKCDAVDECVPSPCGPNTCINELDGFSCVCSGGYSGLRCETPPDHCVDHACQNSAECVNHYTNYSCVCESGYRGPLCEETIVNGGWNAWSAWTDCSATCNGGMRSRTRNCTSPEPDLDGLPCSGQGSMTEECNKEDCPSCVSLPRSYGVERNCTSADDLTQCTIKCRKGLMFIEPVLPVYRCGRSTDYRWTHQTEDNPRAKLPSCSAVSSSRGYKFTHHVTYPDLQCDTISSDWAAITSQLTAQTKNLTCRTEGTCKMDVDQVGCAHRRKREAGGPISITLTIDKDAISKFNITGALGDSSQIAKLTNYLSTVVNFEKSAQQLVNNSDSVFKITLGGKTFSVDPNSGSSSVDIDCPPGTTPTTSIGLCGECPAGSREERQVCVLCGRGFYQDSPASVACVQCPAGQTTPGLGARSRDECTDDGRPVSNPDSDTGKDDNSLMILAITLPTISAVVLIAVVVFVAWKIKGNKPTRSSSSVLPKQDPPAYQIQDAWMSKSPMGPPSTNLPPLGT